MSGDSRVFEVFDGLSDSVVSLRFATAGDYCFVRSLVCDPASLSALNDTGESAEATLRQLWSEGLATADMRHFVAVGQRQVRIAYFRLLYPFQTNGRLWLSYLNVAPEMRSQRYGTRIMKLLLSEARRNSAISSFGMHTGSSNAHALRLYQSLGFTCTRQEPWENQDGTKGDRLTLIHNLAVR